MISEFSILDVLSTLFVFFVSYESFVCSFDQRSLRSRQPNSVVRAKLALVQTFNSFNLRLIMDHNKEFWGGKRKTFFFSNTHNTDNTGDFSQPDRHSQPFPTLKVREKRRSTCGSRARQKWSEWQCWLGCFSKTLGQFCQFCQPPPNSGNKLIPILKFIRTPDQVFGGPIMVQYGC